MLPNETLMDVFRWFDRRFLETVVRLASWRANAIVQAMAKTGPNLFIDDLYLYIGENHVNFDMITEWPKKDGNEQRKVYEGPWIPSYGYRKPFNVYDPTSIPPYLYFDTVVVSHIVISPTREQLANPFVERHTQYGRRNSINFSVNGVPGADLMVQLHDRCWGGNDVFITSIINRPDLLVSRSFRTISDLYATSVTDATIPFLADWLARPAEPSHWNPSPVAMKHFRTEMTVVTFVRRLFHVLTENFMASRTPFTYHIEIKEIEPSDEDDFELRTITYRNDYCREILTERTHYNHTEIWRQPDYSSHYNCQQIANNFAK